MKSCPICGKAVDADEGERICAECEDRREASRSTLPGKVSAKLGDMSVVRWHGDGDMLVQEPGGTVRFVIYGAEESIALEVAVLSSFAGKLPSIVKQGQATPFGHFAVLTADLDGAVLLRDRPRTWSAALTTVRSVLDLAEAIEAQGFAWEPVPNDFYVKPGGELVVVRVRGARRLLQAEPLNAKRVLEALGDAVLPAPFGQGTPEFVRLFLPPMNFSTAATRTSESVRGVIAQAEAIVALKVAGRVAELCDPGLRRHHNEDATALAEGDVHGEPFTVLVVCDGVSSATHSERASSIASQVARDTLAQFARSGSIANEPTPSAVLEAIRAAHVAVCTSDIDYGDLTPPGTTIVAAVVFRKQLTVGWVGDSRAYWVSEHGAELCTSDHSWMNDALARGEVTEAEAMASPFAHALTKCLGPLETGPGAVYAVDPDVRTKALTGPGHLILCTDGLWNYFPAATDIAALVTGAGKDADPSAIARFLVCRALAEGGGDNVSVAVHAFS